MSSKLSRLINNLSEIYSKNVEIKTAKMNVSLKDLKITNFLMIARSVEKNS